MLYLFLFGTPLWDKLKDKLVNVDFLDLLGVEDLARGKPWKSHISDKEINALRRKAYLSFHITRMVYHPLAFLRPCFNVLRDIEEAKTERTFRQFLKRWNIKKKKFTSVPSRKSDADLNAYSYDANTTLKIPLQNKSNHAYSNSLLKTYQLAKKAFLVFEKKREIISVKKLASSAVEPLLA